MLANRPAEWKKAWTEEARAEGRVEGRVEGRAEGEASLLVRLLQRRFGTVPETALRRIATAKPAELEAWFDRAVDALHAQEADIEAVFT